MLSRYRLGAGVSVRRLRVAVGVAAGVLVVGAVALFLLRRGDEEAAATPANNVSGNFRACLVRAANGAGGSAAWDALRKAAATGRVNAQQFPVPVQGEVRAAQLNGLIGVGCDVVVVADKVLIPAVGDVAAKAKTQRFLIVGKGASSGNVEVLGDAAGLSAWISSHVGG
jgi:hypothetical protein